eukprot:SAG31_NODE_5002_length_2807_cov_33.203471_2_plen_130_part_00
MSQTISAVSAGSQCSVRSLGVSLCAARSCSSIEKPPSADPAGVGVGSGRSWSARAPRRRAELITGVFAVAGGDDGNIYGSDRDRTSLWNIYRYGLSGSRARARDERERGAATPAYHQAERYYPDSRILA